MARRARRVGAVNRRSSAGKLLLYGKARYEYESKYLALRLGAISAELRIGWLCLEYLRRGTSSGVERRIEVYRFGQWDWEVCWWVGR